MPDQQPKDLPLTQGKEEVFNELVNGASGTRVVRIRYRDSSGNVSERSIEPYEFKNGKLFAYDTEKQAIRSFKIESIMSALRESDTYEPRFPVLIDTSMRV